MVKKFSEFIEEGFMTRSLDRSKSGEKRLEDKQEPVEYICDFLNRLLSRFFEKSKSVCEWKEISTYNKESVRYLITIHFSKFDSKYPDFQFQVYNKLKDNNIPDLFREFNNGFIHGRAEVDTDHITPKHVIKKYKILNDDGVFPFIFCVFQTKLEYTHKFHDFGGGRGSFSSIKPEDVDIKSMLDINKDIKQLPDGRYVFKLRNDYGRTFYINPPII